VELIHKSDSLLGSERILFMQSIFSNALSEAVSIHVRLSRTRQQGGHLPANQASRLGLAVGYSTWLKWAAREGRPVNIAPEDGKPRHLANGNKWRANAHPTARSALLNLY